ncbi:phospholipase [Micromonospora sp. NPDC048909]|uniref:phospholipase n=1 Tax=Micromonospora sp. NPDC048909 TaxID=3155643 RepID=UPI0033F3D980
MEPSAYGPSETGSVVLDVGGATGALIIYTGRELHGREIEISPADRPDGPRTHAAVRERRVQDGVFHSAVYPYLPAGVYTVWWDERRTAGAICVTGGVVAEFVWPSSVPSGFD